MPPLRFRSSQGAAAASGVAPVRSIRFVTELLDESGDRADGLPELVATLSPVATADSVALAIGHRVFGPATEASAAAFDAALAERALHYHKTPFLADAHRSRPERTSVAVAALRALATQLVGDVALVVVTLDGRDGSIGSIVGALAADDCRRAERAPLRALACAEASASLASTPSLLFLIDFAVERSVTMVRIACPGPVARFDATGLSKASRAALRTLRARLEASEAADS